MAHERKREISFFITTYCNLACTYCVNDTKNVSKQKSIDLDFAKAGLEDFFFKRPDLFGFNNNSIRFYAIGEPTTRIDLIKQITDNARELKGDKLFVELQTNGVFPEETADWIADNVDEVWISLDGPPEMQNKNRPTKDQKPTAETAEKNIRYLLEKKVFVGVRPTITPESVERQKEIVDYMGALGVKWIYAEPQFESIKQNGSNCKTSITSINLQKYVENFVEAYKHAEKAGIHYGNFFTMNFDEPCKYACRACLPMPQLTVDGYVSGCDLVYSGNTQLSDFIFGKFDKKKKEIVYFPEKIQSIRQRQPNNIEECSSCEVKENCGGGCAGLAYYATGNYLGTVKEFCDATRYLAKHIPRNKGAVEHLHP